MDMSNPTYTQSRRNVLGTILDITVDGLTISFAGHSHTVRDAGRVPYYLDAIGELVGVTCGDESAYIRPFGSGFEVGMVGAGTAFTVRDRRAAERLAYEICSIA